VSKIKDRLDIVDVISGYLKVHKSGINYKARCPFHNEKTPSFFISPERQIWHCFGCAKGGDMFSFIQDIEGVEFIEALKLLAQRAGIELNYSSDNLAIKDDKSVLYEICENASRFFEKQLNNSVIGKKAMLYLKSRGLTEDTAREFRLGFAPSEWESLSVFLRNFGYKDTDIINAGLAIKREGSNGIYDRFRSRIIFPISDLSGQIVGFTGRIFESNFESIKEQVEPAKYINTPQTVIYDKSRILYGLNKAKAEIRREGKCVLVEGNMDVLMSHQAGIKNVVATSGTSLTSGHLKIIKRYTSNLNFCFDTDQAGATATRRGIGLALANELNVKVIEITDKECKDPADYVKKYSKIISNSIDGTENKSSEPTWPDIVARAKPILEFYFDKARKEFDPNSAESKKTVISILAPFVKRLSSQVEKAHWVAQLAFLLRTKEDVVEADIGAMKDDLPLENFDDKVVQTRTLAIENNLGRDGVQMRVEKDMLSQALLSVVMKNPTLFKGELKNVQFGLLDKHTADIISKLAAGDFKNINEMMSDFRKNEKSYKLEFAYLKSQELWKDFGDEDLKLEFENLITKINERSINAQLNSLVYDIKEAEIKKDKNKIVELVEKFGSLTKELAKAQTQIKQF